MGGHFLLEVVQTDDLQRDLQEFGGRLVCTAPRGGLTLREANLSGRLGWIFGGEGPGVSESSIRRAEVQVTIPMSAGSESLNVAASAAICLYEGFSRPAGGS
jgi:TrmH family RNA methyltransferase